MNTYIIENVNCIILQQYNTIIYIYMYMYLNILLYMTVCEPL